MRNMSFALTTAQVRAQTKTVTRRLGWTWAKVGDVVMPCEKCQGIKRGELVRIEPAIVFTGKRREALRLITPEDVVREGFPEMTRAEFIDMFCDHMKIRPSEIVTRLEFAYLVRKN